MGKKTLTDPTDLIGVIPKLPFSVAILAGGRSSRMGRDKATLRLGRRTLLGHVRALARELGLPVRVIRSDLVPRCGPVGGIYTALKTSQAAAELFLACDMPFISTALLRQVWQQSASGSKAVFVTRRGMAGFPFLLPVFLADRVEQQIREREWSLQALARRVRAKRLRVPDHQAQELANVNSREDWREAQRLLKMRLQF